VIFQNAFKRKIEQTAYAQYAGDWSREASSFVQVVKMWSREGEQGIMREAVINAYVESLKMIWIVICVLAGIAFVLSLIFIKEISLERELETEQAFIHDRKSPSVTVKAVDEEKGYES
jgi:hypothetical protein